MENDDKPQDFVVRCRGLPWSCTEADIKEFLGSAGTCVTSIQFTKNREGRPSGEAYIVLSNENAYQAALARDRDNMGHRYIEIFEAKQSEMDHVTNASEKIAQSSNEDGIVRMRGLPFGCTKEEIASFFLGLQISPNGIVMSYDRNGKPTGECFVCFVDTKTADRALQNHMHNIQHRYIEVFRSSHNELERTMRAMGHNYGPSRDPWGTYGYQYLHERYGPYDRPNDPGQYRDGSRSVYCSLFDNDIGGGYAGYGGYESGGYGGYRNDGYYGRPLGGGPMRDVGRRARGRDWTSRGSRGGGLPAKGARPFAYEEYKSANSRNETNNEGRHCIKMRGLPFRATEQDVKDFFSPLRLISVDFLPETATGRPSGEARVEFYTHLDAIEAMKRDREHMGSRYVELFPETSNSERMLY